jgi:hypothetical protein
MKNLFSLQSVKFYTLAAGLCRLLIEAQSRHEYTKVLEQRGPLTGVFTPNYSSCRALSHIFSECLKGLSHEIFGPVFWPVWMYLGLNVNRLWFLNFNYALLILDN